MNALDRPAPPLIVFSFVLGLLAIAASRSIWNIDLFWHLAAGRWILEHGAFPTTDVFSSLDPERAWITFQWLYEVGVYHLDQWGGLGLIRLVHAALLLLAFGLFFRITTRLTQDRWIAATMSILLLVIYDVRIRVRPHILILLFLIVFLPVLFGSWKNHSWRKNLWAFVLPMALLANLHAGGALILLAISLAIPAGEALQRAFSSGEQAQNARPLEAVKLWAVAALATVLMPCFVRGVIHAVTMLGASESLTREWHPSWSWFGVFSRFADSGEFVPAYLLSGLLPFLVLAVLLGGLYQSIRRHGLPDTFSRIHPTEILLALGCTAIALRYSRFVWISMVPCLVLVRWAGPSLQKSLWRKAIVGITLVLLVVGVATVRTTNIQLGRTGLFPTADEITRHLSESKFPRLTANFMRTAGLKGSVWTPPGWGGYLLWTLYPDVTVSSDGRGNYDQKEADDISTLWRVFNPETHPGAEEVQAVYHRHETLQMLLLPLPPGGLPSTMRPPADRWQRVFPPPELWLRELGLPFAKDHGFGQALYLRRADVNAENLAKARKTYEESAARIRKEAGSTGSQ